MATFSLTILSTSFGRIVEGGEQSKAEVRPVANGDGTGHGLLEYQADREPRINRRGLRRETTDPDGMTQVVSMLIPGQHFYFSRR